jgi:hypothetical protein
VPHVHNVAATSTNEQVTHPNLLCSHANSTALLKRTGTAGISTSRQAAHLPWKINGSIRITATHLLPILSLNKWSLHVACEDLRCALDSTRTVRWSVQCRSAWLFAAHERLYDCLSGFVRRRTQPRSRNNHEKMMFFTRPSSQEYGELNYPNSPKFWSYGYGRLSLIAGMVPSGKYRLNFITQPLSSQTTLRAWVTSAGSDIDRCWNQAWWPTEDRLGVSGFWKIAQLR